MNYIVRSRNRHTLHVRVVVPEELRSIVGKRELRRSLHTDSPLLGRLRALAFAHHVNTLFQAMKKSKDNPAVLYDITAALANGLTVRLVHPYTEKELADFKEIVGVNGNTATEAPKPALPIGELWKLYAKERTAAEGWSDKTKQEMHGPVKRYQAYCDKNKLDPYAKSTAASYKSDSLLTAITKRGGTLKPETVNQHIDRLSALFRWAVDNGKAAVDPFVRLKVKIGAKARVAKKRQPYSFIEVERLLAALNPAKDERHFAVLVGLYTGCRVNEAAQLYADDVQEEEEGGVSYIHIREGRPDQKVKGHKPRKVPISPHLIKAGFLAWVATKRPEARLFPTFTHGRDGYGQSCSKWYNRTFRKQAGMTKDFHSLRHTTQAALDARGVPERVINAILGHAAGKSMSLTAYEHGLPLEVLEEAIGKLPLNPGRK